ncbi:hypothetical protein [Metapseudomonas otitidis]|uniref:hypothetical protein n=1 Tax=Metapseudomonas otitidis TaxID=319939 RepID=UPI002446E351|nr:hypothetical protein [Pseudomonas otitidis]MDH0334636.1 hypothetical protein [Pseudomonas otitidis]
MKYHSTNPSDRPQELLRAIQLATSLAEHVLLVSPSTIDGLNDQLGKALPEEFAKKLFKHRQVVIPFSDTHKCTYYLSTTSTKSAFSSGVVVLPWASLHTVDWAVRTFSSSHTIFIPNEDPNSSIRGEGKDELTQYQLSYPESMKF